MSRLIDADALYERACGLEAQALDYVGKLIERDGEEISVEWKIWSAILVERTAFRHDLFDAPTVEERKTGKWIYIRAEESGNGLYQCSVCSKGDTHAPEVEVPYCWNCGAKMIRPEGE